MYLNPDSMKSQSNAAIKVLKSDEKKLDKSLKSIDAFVNDKEIESEAFNNLKVHMADYHLVVQALKKAATADKEDHEKLKGVMDGIDGIIDCDKLDTAIEDAQERKKKYEDMKYDFPAALSYYDKMISDCDRIIVAARKRKEQYREANRTTKDYFSQGNSIRTNTDMAITSLGAASYSTDSSGNIQVTGVDKSKWHSGLMDATVVDTARELSDVSIENMTYMQQMRMGQMVAYLVDDADAETMEKVAGCYYDPVTQEGHKLHKCKRKGTAKELMASIDSYAQGRAFYTGGLDEKQKQRHIVMLTALREKELAALPQIAGKNKKYDVTLTGTTLEEQGYQKMEYQVGREVDHSEVMDELHDAIGDNLDGILTDSYTAEVLDMASTVGKTALMMALPELGIGSEIAIEACDLVITEADELDENKKRKDLVMDNYEQTDIDLVVDCLGGTPMWVVDGEGGYVIRTYPLEVTDAAIDEANEYIKAHNERIEAHNEWVKAHNESGKKPKKPVPLIEKKEFTRDPVAVNEKLKKGLTTNQKKRLKQTIANAM